MGQHITRELGDDVKMTSEDSDEVFEHEDNDTWETDIKQLMSEAALFQQDSLLSCNGRELSHEQLLQLVDKKDEALMLAAKIGHSLLTKITCLIARNKELEQQIDESADQISQLEFDKTQLNSQLKLTTSYSEDTDDEQDSLDGTTRRRRQSSCCSVSACCADEVESLRSKLNEVESEKFELERRVEELETELRAETDRMKQQEIQRQVEWTSTERELRYLRDKLTNKRCSLQTTEEQLNRAKLEIVYLAGQLVQMEVEMEKLQARLENSQRDNSMLQCQYDDALHQREEYMALCNTLRETHGHRRQRRATVCGESSIAQELSTGFLSTQQQQQHHLPSTENLQRRLFETMKFLNMTVQCPTRSCPVSTSIECRVVSRCQCHRPDTTTTITAGADHWRDTGRVLGQPGRPGSSDLTNSLLRLQWLADKRRRLPSLLSTTDEQIASTEDYCSECQSLADVTPTFDNVISPRNKLQLVKVMEGSWLLQGWRQLSTAHLGALFDVRGGVFVRGCTDVLGSAPSCQQHEPLNTPSHQPCPTGLNITPPTASPTGLNITLPTARSTGLNITPPTARSTGLNITPPAVRPTGLITATNINARLRSSCDIESSGRVTLGLNNNSIPACRSVVRCGSVQPATSTPSTVCQQTQRTELNQQLTAPRQLHPTTPLRPPHLSPLHLAACIEEQEEELDSSYSSSECEEDEY